MSSNHSAPVCPTACHHVRVAEGVEFDIVVNASAQDAVSKHFADGAIFENNPLELMLSVIKPGQTVLDLGAHLGTFSLAAAAAGCRVIAVEASPENVSLLRASAEKNRFHNLQVVHAAVSDRPGTLKFFSYGPYGHVATSENEAKSVEVRALAVDDLLAELGVKRVDFIKLDVEGSEIKAVDGMRKLLGGSEPPIMVFESNGHTLNFYGRRPSELMRALERLGFEHHLIGPKVLLRSTSFDVQPSVCLDYLATRRTPPHLAGWTYRGPHTEEEVIRALYEQSKSPAAEHRAYVARALADAPQRIADDPRMQHVLATLQIDTHPLVCGDAGRLPRQLKLPVWKLWWHKVRQRAA
jgi:FkbM family methyltransferase